MISAQSDIILAGQKPYYFEEKIQMNSKLIFIDIDGTLINYNSELPDSAALALKKAKENGHKIFIATGRCRKEIYPFILEMNFDGILGASGAYLEYDDKVVLNRTIDSELLSRTIEVFEKRNAIFSLECPQNVYVSEEYLRQMKMRMGEAAGNNAVSLLENVMTVTDCFLDKTDVNKICVTLPKGEDVMSLKEELGDYYDVDSWSISVDISESGELCLKGVNKASGVKKFMEFFGVGVEDTIALGDSANDLSMIEFCGMGVAMGNATDAIKKAADYITTDVNNDGLYNAFVHLGLI